MNRDHLLFLRLHTNTAFQTLLLTMTPIPFLLRDSCPQGPCSVNFYFNFLLGYVLSLLLSSGQTMVEVVKIMATSFKGPMHALLHSVPPTLHQATANPHLLCQKLLDTHRQVWVSPLCGHCSFLLGPSLHKFVPSKSVSPVLCKFWRLYGGLMVTSSKRTYAIPRSGASRAPASSLMTHTSGGDTQTQFWLSLCGALCVLVCTRFVWALPVSLTGMGFDSKRSFAPPTILPGLFLCSWTWSIFFWWEPMFSCQLTFRSKL